MRKTLIASSLLLLLAFWSAQGTSADSPQGEELAQVTVAEPAPPSKPKFEKTERQESPLSLTTSDGTGLKLIDFKAKAVMEGPLAFTELHLTFENPEDRVLEGRFQITLPDKAAISRFAMMIEDKWQEAEVVERQAARRAYEDFLHRRQDPALLEKEAGNEFRARIFPIPAKGRKHLIISYSQELVGSQAYRLPLQGLPRVNNLDLDVRVSKSDGKTLRPESVRIQRQDFLPEGDFVVPQATGIQGLASGNFVVARLNPELSAKSQAPTDLLVLVDTSASRALGFESQVQLLPKLFQQLPSLKKVTVAAFDQSVERLYQGHSQGFQAKTVLQRRALGATDLAGALAWAGRQQGHTRLLLITDGISTAGKDDLLKSLHGSSLKRLDVITVGGIRDKEKMGVLVEGALAQEGMVLSGESTPQDLAESLSLSVTSGLDLNIDGAKWVWPSTLNNVQPGDQRLVYAQFDQPRQSLTVKLPQQELTVQLQTIEDSPLLSRSAAVAQIERLQSSLAELTDKDDRKSVNDEIIELSTTHRVLSDKTALLVLESEEDYARFNIDRNALADILVVSAQGLELRHRKNLVVAKVPVVEKLKSKKSDYKDSKEVSFGDDQDKGADEEEKTGLALNSQAEGGGGTTEPEPSAVTSNGPPRQDAPPPEASRRRVARPQPEPVVTDGTPATGVRASVSADEEAELSEEDSDDEVGSGEPALTGKLAEITELLQKGDRQQALRDALAWQKAEPGNVLALIALGECYEALGKLQEAARVYGSIIDLFPSRADLRRYAGSRLQNLEKAGIDLAVDSFRKATEQRADHVSSHRFLAFALARQGDYEASFEALEAGLKRDYPDNRFAGYQRILREDLGIVGTVWAAKSPARRKEIQKRLKGLSSKLTKQPSLRFVLTWETDANDVDFHIHDAKKGHAYYSKKALATGGELFADVTTGYGPECFAIPGKAKAFPYRLQIHYYSRGPMGYGMGQLEILQHDGKGGLKFEQRPYVVMNDGAYVDLGIVEQPL